MPGVPLLTLHGPSTTKRTRVLDSIKSSGGIVITTYGTLVTQAKQLTEGVRWELLVLDEANKVLCWCVVWHTGQYRIPKCDSNGAPASKVDQHMLNFVMSSEWRSDCTSYTLVDSVLYHAILWYQTLKQAISRICDRSCAPQVKNPGTQAANAADAVQAHMKLLLTGTPIQVRHSV